MNKPLIGIVLATLLVVSFVIASTFTVANDSRNRPEKVAYATVGTATLDLPSNATYPAKAGGTPNHPTNLRITVYDNNRRSTDGASDQLMVSMWDPVGQSYSPVLIITDNAAWAEYLKVLYNNTYAWYPTPLSIKPIYGPNLFPNVVLVAPGELEVWTEDVNQYGHRSGGDNNEVLMANLTRAVNVKLDLFVVNSSAPTGPNTGRSANVTFNLPALTMMFHEFDDYYPSETTNVLQWAGSTNYTVKQSFVEVSARVEMAITGWTGGATEFLGHVHQDSVAKFYPPAT
jgi:hypothetical protein